MERPNGYFYSVQHEERVLRYLKRRKRSFDRKRHQLTLKRLAVVLGLLGSVIVVGLIGHGDYVQQQQIHAQNVCRYQDETTAPTFDQCLANQLELQ